MSARFEVTVGTETLPVEVVDAGVDGARYRVRLGDDWLDVDVRGPETGPASLLIAGASHVVDEVREEDGDLVVTLDGEAVRVRVEEPGRGRGRRAGGRGGAGQRLVAPMPGRVVLVHVAVGDRVAPGAPLVVLEAMKMENEFHATDGGVVTEVAVAAGQAVNAGDLLVVVSP